MVRKAVVCALSLLGMLCGAAAGADVTITVAPACYNVGDLITVEIHKGATPIAVVGGQFFLTYDSDKVVYVGGLAGDPPYTFTVLDHPVGASDLDYAVGVPGGGPGVTADRVMARLVFKAVEEVCGDTDVLKFRGHNPPSRLTDALGMEVPEPMHDLATAVTIDSTPPDITCPPNVTVNADAGTCTHTFAVFPPATATDNCGPTTVTASRDDNPVLTVLDPFPTGTTHVTWTATDCAGNIDTCVQNVTVAGMTDMLVTVELKDVVAAPFQRCITFDLQNTGTCMTAGPTVEVPLTFTGTIGTGVVSVPCGFYNCISARDRLHTLRRRANTGHFGISGVNYVCSFTNDGFGDDSLLGGNINDDFVIDILDFGGFIGQFNVNYGTGSTDCMTSPLHADFSGNGFVDILDYSFISTNFLAFRELGCCGGALAGDAAPITDISVADLAARGEWKMAAQADVNRDGRLNLADVTFVLQHGVSRCAADFDNVNGATIDDIFVYVNAWFMPHPACDMNGDRAVTIDDLFGFISVWLAGCD